MQPHAFIHRHEGPLDFLMIILTCLSILGLSVSEGWKISNKKVLLVNRLAGKLAIHHIKDETSKTLVQKHCFRISYIAFI